MVFWEKLLSRFRFTLINAPRGFIQENKSVWSTCAILTIRGLFKKENFTLCELDIFDTFDMFDLLLVHQ